jgi:hypothetical protein
MGRHQNEGCSVPACENKHYGRGYCKKHYEALKRAGEITPKTGNYGTHRQHGTSEYHCWSNMKSRCDNPKNKMYPNYGGAGISYCERWKKFENFIEDMGKKPSKDHSLDRIDPYKDYCPENCRWAICRVQANNKRKHQILEYNGLKMNEKEWITFLHEETEKLKKGR